MMKRRAATGSSGGNMMTVEEEAAIGGGVSSSSSARNGNEEEEVPLMATSTWMESAPPLLSSSSSPRTEQFRSTYVTNDSKIQDILHSIAWSDPFYERPTTTATNMGANGIILAVFDINVKQLQQALELQGIILACGLFFAIVAFLIGLTPTGDSYDNFYISSVLFFPILTMSQAFAMVLKEINMIGRRHIAVTTRGIYLDAATDAHTNQVAQRRVIPYDTIETCAVNETGLIQPVFQVSIVTKGKPALVHTFAGLSSGQAFVDLVNALVEQTKINESATSQDEGTAGGGGATDTAGTGAASVMAKECV
jgi:hypothetical protein